MRLAESQRQQYRQDGILHPLQALAPAQARAHATRFESFDSRLRASLNLPQYPKVHLVSRWIHGLVVNPELLDAVESLLGPDILCWSTAFFAKPPRDARFVGWHQDATFWGLEPLDGIVTAWLALTESGPENGCMQVVPGSHRAGQLEHWQSLDAQNLLQSGQQARYDFRQTDVRDVVLEPGQFSLHHPHLLHGSPGNASRRPRVGIAIQYVSAHVRSRYGWDSGMLLRGRDWGHFELEPEPSADFDEAAMEAFIRALRAPSGLGRSAKMGASV